MPPHRRRRSDVDAVPFSVFNKTKSNKTSKSASSDSKLLEAPWRKSDPASESSVSKKSKSASSDPKFVEAPSKSASSDSKILDVKIEEDDDDEQPAGGGVNEGAASA